MIHFEYDGSIVTIYCEDCGKGSNLEYEWTAYKRIKHNCKVSGKKFRVERAGGDGPLVYLERVKAKVIIIA